MKTTTNSKDSRKLNAQRGAALVEMGLLIVLIAVLAIPALRQTGQAVRCSMCDAASPQHSGNGLKNYCLSGGNLATWGVNC